MRELLAVQGLTAGYADAVVLEDIDLLVHAGESISLLGRNGMGKTTLLTSVMGLTRLRKGTIRLDGREITHVPTHRRSRMGVGWVPQERLTFASLTVLEHITAVARPGYWNVKTIFDALPSLQAKKSNRGKELSGGEQQMLAIARALATNPRLLLLDEPLEGLAPIVAQEILRVLKRLVGQEGLSMILVEQHAKEALAITDRAIVLERGRIAYSGSSAKLIDDDALLGGLLALAST